MEEDEDQAIHLIEDVGVVAAAAVGTVINKEPVEENQQKQSDDSSYCTKYQIRTFRPGSINSLRRASILPAYPLARNNSNQKVLLLLSNVYNIDRDKCEKESFCGGYGISPFEFKQHRYVESIDSFIIDLYRDLFIKPSRKWKIPYSLIDFNLHRLRTCMQLYTKQTKKSAFLSLNELPIALEFYLQIDVDLFFMKTCNYCGAHPRLFGRNGDEIEGIICQEEPIALYEMKPCYDKHCFLCCQSKRGEKNGKLLNPMVHFSPNQSHRFVNKYETILNCNANCITSNIIYALTCLCGQCDFIGSTSINFHDRMLKHRNENNRIVREFLIGRNNIELINKQESRTEEILTNNEMLLYQHSTCCPLVLQRFLNNNPDYWCLVPMLYQEARMDDNVTASSDECSKVSDVYITVAHHFHQQQQPPVSPTFATKPKFFEEILRNTTRSTEECIWLAKGVPKPPSGFRFSRRQIEKQIDFFKFKKETHVLPSNLIDFYKYTIIAVLPDDCSHELRGFIEALFITHAETKLNTFGRLTHKGPWPTATNLVDHSNRKAPWCEKLKWGFYTWNAWDVFQMNRKGEAVLPFSRRPVPVNLFSYIRMQTRTTTTTPWHTRIFRPITPDDIITENNVYKNINSGNNLPNKMDNKNNINKQHQNEPDRFPRTSTPKLSVIQEEEEESSDYSSISTWSADDDCEPSEFLWDPYNTSYDWES